MNVLVIDIGTSSMRGILFQQDGKKLATHQVKYSPIHNANGEVEQPASDWKEVTIEIIREIVNRSKDIKQKIEAVAITAQRSSVISVDKNGNALLNTIMWQDTRNKGICDELKNYNDLIFQRSGAYVNTVFLGSKITWIRKYRPDIYEKTYKFANIPSYLMNIMTGEFNTDYTYGSRSNLMNLRECKWDPELLDLFQVDENKLCELREPGSICGSTSKEISALTGIDEGIPVISSGGDQQCAAVGQGVYKEGNLSIVTGTGGFLVTASDQVPEELEPDVICNYSALRRKYIIEANVLTCCSAFDWFCNNFYDSENIDYEQIGKELEAAGGSDACLVLPYFQGRSTPDWNAGAKATFTNITLGTKRGDILKGLLEGIFLEIRNNIDNMKKYCPISQAYISGGLTKNKAFNQIQADVYGIPLFHLEDSESTAIGALIVALNGLGVYKSIEEAFSIIRSNDKFETYIPDRDRHKYYLKRQREMNRLYQNIYKTGGDESSKELNF